jgi:periodic tryptophan protein 1
MITATTWVRRGVAAPFPVKYEIDEDEMNRISQLARLQLEDARQDLKDAQDGEKGAETMDQDNEESGEASTSAPAGKGKGKDS